MSIHHDTDEAMLTTKQVLAACGFKSLRTLQRWRERNLVPPPSLQRHPNGRGMCWMWPVWTVRHIDAIKKRVAAGESLDGVARTLSGDWEAEAKKWIRQRPSFKETYERMLRREAIDRFAESISDSVYEYLRSIGVERPGRIDDKIWKAVSKDCFVNDALDLLRRGCNPFLIVTNREVVVAADFIVGAALGSAENRTQPALIVPMRDVFLEAFAKAEPELPKVAKFEPAMHVVERGDEKTLIRPYRLRDKWKFALTKGNERSPAPSTGGNPQGLRRQHSRRRSM
jgi:hypothetical protein